MAFALPWEDQLPKGNPPQEPPNGATLETVAQSEFFRYPGWWPSAVPSDFTPGSSDTYVPALTGSVFTTSFMVSVASTNTLDLSPVPDESRFPDADGRFHWQKQFLDGDTDCDPSEELVGGPAPFFFTWQGEHAVYDATGGCVVVTNTYRANAHTYTNVTAYTGYWTTRAMRLTARSLAAVNSTFEAVYERLYYGSKQGAENDWDESATGWGGKTAADFRLDGCEVSNEWARSDFQDYHSPASTNVAPPDYSRELFSRRFVEFDNLCRFTGHGGIVEPTNTPPYGRGLGGSMVRDGLERFMLARPSWHGGWLWSSTAFDAALAPQDLPELTGSVDPWWEAGGSNVWAFCCHPFATLRGEDGYFRGRTAAPRWPVADAFRALNFQEGIWHIDGDPNQGVYYDARLSGGVHSLTDVLTNVYRCATPHLIASNATRRLHFDRLGEANQVLGLMDRTIHDNLVAVTSTVLNTSVAAKREMYGTFLVFLDPDEPSGVVYINWSPTSSLERSIVTNSWRNVVGYHMLRLDSGSSSWGYDIMPYYGSMYEITLTKVPDDGEYLITGFVGTGPMRGPWSIILSEVDGTNECSITVNDHVGGSDDFYIRAWTTVGYDVERTPVTPSDFHVVESALAAPGMPRVKSLRLFNLNSWGIVDLFTDPMAIREDMVAWWFDYAYNVIKSTPGSYAAIKDYSYLAASAGWEQMMSAAGNHPAGWRFDGEFPILSEWDMDHVRTCIHDVRFDGLELIEDWRKYTSIVTRPDGTCVLTSHDDITGVTVVTQGLPLLVAHFEHDINPVVEGDPRPYLDEIPLTAVLKHRDIEFVDWRWNALRRGDE